MISNDDFEIRFFDVADAPTISADWGTSWRHSQPFRHADADAIIRGWPLRRRRAPAPAARARDGARAPSTPWCTERGHLRFLVADLFRFAPGKPTGEHRGPGPPPGVRNDAAGRHLPDPALIPIAPLGVRRRFFFVFCGEGSMLVQDRDGALLFPCHRVDVGLLHVVY